MASAGLLRRDHRLLDLSPLRLDNRVVSEWHFPVEKRLFFRLPTRLNLDSDYVAIAGG